MSTSEPALSGGCECGEVKYSSTKLPVDFTNCHCTTCRQLSGAAFLTFGAFTKDDIKWTSGESSLTKTSSNWAERGRCSKCGSHIYMTYKCEPEYIGITAGTIDGDSVRGTLPAVKHHIFVREGKRAAWEQLPDDNLPRYPKFSTRFQKKLEDWEEATNSLMS